MSLPFAKLGLVKRQPVPETFRTFKRDEGDPLPDIEPRVAYASHIDDFPTVLKHFSQLILLNI